MKEETQWPMGKVYVRHTTQVGLSYMLGSQQTG